MKKFFLPFLPLLATVLGNGCAGPGSTADIPAVGNFDVKRYMGRWYEIARLPVSFQKGMTGVSADYSLNEKTGIVTVINSGFRNRDKSFTVGKAWLAGPKDRGELRVRFFFPFSAPYRIIRLDRNYTVSVVTAGDRSYLWILARRPKIAPEKLRELTAWARSKGFDTEKLIYAEGNAPATTPAVSPAPATSSPETPTSSPE